MNYGAGIAVLIGGVALLIGIKGTQSSVWKTLTGNAITPSKDVFGFNAASSSANSGFVAGGSARSSSNTANADAQTKYGKIAYADASAQNINPFDFVEQIKLESNFNPNAVSPAGAIGIAQFMPSTASSLGVDPKDPIASLKGAAALMANYIINYGSESKALAAYNAGPQALQNAVNQGGSNWMQYLPQETQTYINTIITNAGG